MEADELLSADVYAAVPPRFSKLSVGYCQMGFCLCQYTVAAGAILSQQVLRLGATPHPGMQLRAFYACVPPVASYACELWSARALPQAANQG